MPANLLEVVDLVKHYEADRALFRAARHVHAVDGVSLDLAAGETLALIGESGCGKSSLAKCLVGLETPTRGEIRLDGRPIIGLTGRELRRSRKLMQMVFQDPYASLNPRRTLYKTLADPMRLHAVCPPARRRAKVAELLGLVGLGDEYMDRHPHELSGGQRQRVAIARALAVEPKAVICDEPVSALDVSIQAQIINLLKRLQDRFGLSYLFISHDLRLVQRVSHRIAVMYLGQIVEIADAVALRERALHPYTQALYSSAPIADPQAAAAARRRRHIVVGDVPSPLDPPRGCRFHTRCPYRREVCSAQAPELRVVAGRRVRCHFAGEPGFPPPLSATADALPTARARR